MKGFAQRHALDMYPKTAIEKAREEGEMDIISAIKRSPILALRQRVLDKETEAVIADMSLPY